MRLRHHMCNKCAVAFDHVMQMPDVDLIKRQLSIVLTGPTRHGRQTKSSSIEHALGIGGVLHVNAVNVIQHVRYFCAVNPDYQRRRIVERGASTNK